MSVFHKMYFDGGLAEHMDTQHVEIDGSWLGRKMFVKYTDELGFVPRRLSHQGGVSDAPTFIF